MLKFACNDCAPCAPCSPIQPKPTFHCLMVSHDPLACAFCKEMLQIQMYYELYVNL